VIICANTLSPRSDPGMADCSDDFRAAASAAAGRADELQAAAKAALFEAARATALADLSDARAACEREVAERRAALCVETATARAALRVDRLRESAVAGLEEDNARLRKDLADMRLSLSEDVRRCGEFEHDTTNFPGRLLAALQQTLPFCTARELAVTGSVCSGLRIETQNQCLWEVLCRRSYPSLELANCRNFRATFVSHAFSARSRRREIEWTEFASEACLTIEELRDKQKALPRSVMWALPHPLPKKENVVTSDFFSLGPLKERRISFYPRGDGSADNGQCSLYLSLNRGVEVSASIMLNGVHMQTLNRTVGQHAKQLGWGFANFAPAPPRTAPVEIVIEFQILRRRGAATPFDFHDVYA